MSVTKKWRSGAADREQLSHRSYLASLPEHQRRIDHKGVYRERKRLKSKYRGVRWSQRRNADGEWREGRWRVGLELHGTYHYGGEFREENEIAAATAYDDLAFGLFGPTAQFNFPLEVWERYRVER